MRERIWRDLEFRDPRAVLVGFGNISTDLPLETMPYTVSALRTNALNRFREGRQCALFCYGVSQRLGAEIHFAPFEESDTDFVARFVQGGVTHFVPIQMKELVPERVASEAVLQVELDKLKKYSSSPDLVVAFHVNRTVSVDVTSLDFSKIKVKEVWFVGATTADQSRWLLIGNVLGPDWSPSYFDYPKG